MWAGRSGERVAKTPLITVSMYGHHLKLRTHRLVETVHQVDVAESIKIPALGILISSPPVLVAATILAAFGLAALGNVFSSPPARDLPATVNMIACRSEVSGCLHQWYLHPAGRVACVGPSHIRCVSADLFHRHRPPLHPGSGISARSCRSPGSAGLCHPSSWQSLSGFIAGPCRGESPSESAQLSGTGVHLARTHRTPSARRCTKATLEIAASRKGSRKRPATDYLSLCLSGSTFSRLTSAAPMLARLSSASRRSAH